jgi:hypothetical protein
METQRQRAAVERVETLIGLAAPVLDLVLSVGERISRVVAPADEYHPIRPPEESFALDDDAERPLVGVSAAEGEGSDDA